MKSAAQEHYERVEELVGLIKEAPRIPGASMWHSVAYHIIEAGYHNDQPLTVVVQPKPAPQVPQAILDNLKRLQSVASKTANMPANHECRKAGDDLARYAAYVMERYEISPRQLSLKMGLADSTLKNFLIRKGVLQKADTSSGATRTLTHDSFPELDAAVEDIPHVVWGGGYKVGAA